LVIESGSNRRWQTFKSQALPLLMVDDMGLELAKQFAATELDYDGDDETARRQRDRINLDLEQAAFALKMQVTSSGGHKVLKLYNELKSRVLAD
jgi:hypothetical protein